MFTNDHFRLTCFQIDMFTRAYLPKIYAVFDELSITAEFFASQWLFTFFSIDLPFDIVFAAIDMFLLEGYSALIRICLSLLYLIEEELISLPFEEALVYLKTFGKNFEADIHRVFKVA